MKPTLLTRTRCLTTALYIALVCSACGQSGDLYLPTEMPGKPSAEKKDKT